MNYINKVELCGTVGNVSNEENTSNFSLCVINTFTSDNGDTFIRTNWFPIIMFNPPITIEQGMHVKIIGKLSNNFYTATNMVEHKVLFVVAEQIIDYGNK